MSTSQLQESIEDAETEEEMKERIEDAIEENEIIIFMKGNKMMPQCGYSARAVKAVGQFREDFETVDVLRDERIREVLEDVSDWPTIPQVFIGGEFQGGSDIVVEMYENGELEEKIEEAYN
ncbi:MAG: Grx4 family monothiol glutaredoxin [Halobacteria archaeon]|nr:Grx4 family monothiol glutaredoxin [Halobacteria archaeon]